MSNKVLLYVFLTDLYDEIGDEIMENVGEMDVFLNEDGTEVVACWNCNDANWREEYMGQLIKYLGGEVKGFFDADASVQEQGIKTLINEFEGY